MFWLKTQAGWKETVHVTANVSVEDVTPRAIIERIVLGLLAQAEQADQSEDASQNLYRSWPFLAREDERPPKMLPKASRQSSISRQLALAPTRVFPIRVEHPLDVPVQRPQHADPGMHHEVAAFGGTTSVKKTAPAV